jgi:membrane protein DedA with SNARE-associated domain
VNWTDPAAIGYPAVFGGVLLGSIVPIVPTGAVVGAGAAVATTGHLSLPLVLVLAVLGAYAGDVVTFGIPRLGSEAAFRRLSRHQPAERLEKARDRFARRGGRLVVIGRLVPAGRIPVLLAAAALGYPWRRLLPASLLACVLWAAEYAVLGIVSGGIFDSPLVATVLATVLVLLVTVLASLISRWRRRAKTPVESPVTEVVS